MHIPAGVLISSENRIVAVSATTFHVLISSDICFGDKTTLKKIQMLGVAQSQTLNYMNFLAQVNRTNILVCL